MPTTVSITDLKARLSEYLRRVRAGDTVVVTDRGAPIAMVSPVMIGDDADMMKSLVERGVVRPPSSPIPESLAGRPQVPDPDSRVRRAVLDERRSGW